MSELTPEELESYEVDKSSWGEGPWQGEADRYQWNHAGFACLMVRHNSLGHWCGYVGVPQENPAFGLESFDERLGGLEVHGGVTYTDLCADFICHVPEPGFPERVW